MCNTGVGLTPRIEGKVHHFEARGLYNGLSILWDEETGSLWDHITGECLYGSLRGMGLPVYNLLHMNVRQALGAYPDLDVAISKRPIRHRGREAGIFAKIPGLNRMFRGTIESEDTRRPTMDVGLGVWTESRQRYYPLEHVTAAGRYIIDELEGRRVLIYREPANGALAALYTAAESAGWEGDELRLGTGQVLRAGALFDAAGNREEIERPLQVFTRWYGFALTFPEAEIHEPEGP